MDERQFTQAERQKFADRRFLTGFEFTPDPDGVVTIEDAVSQALNAVRREYFDFEKIAQALIDYLHGIDYLYLPTWKAER